jgi:hypothetical protein
MKRAPNRPPRNGEAIGRRVEKYEKINRRI